MALNELNEAEIRQLSGMDVGKAAILFVTPLCGTCKVAERMLEVVDAAGSGYPLYKANINFTPRLRDEWQISSIPCLVLLRNGRVEGLHYAMHDVEYLYSLLKH